MDKDIQFALAVLREEYKARRKTLINGALEPIRADNVLCDLETIGASIIKIEHKFEGESK